MTGTGCHCLTAHGAPKHVLEVNRRACPRTNLLRCRIPSRPGVAAHPVATVGRRCGRHLPAWRLRRRPTWSIPCGLRLVPGGATGRRECYRFLAAAPWASCARDAPPTAPDSPKRVWRLGQEPLPGAWFWFSPPDEVRLRHARRLLARSPVNALLALEGRRCPGRTGPPHLASHLRQCQPGLGLRPGTVAARRRTSR